MPPRGGHLVRVMLPVRGRADLQPFEVPEEVALQMRPELVRPPPRTTNYTGPPYADEIRESKGNQNPLNAVLAGAPEVIVGTLARAWPLIGWGVNPGDLALGGGVNVVFARIYALEQGSRYLVQSFPIPGGTPIGQLNSLAGVRCELAIFVPGTIGAASVTGLRGTIWGSTLHE